MYWHKFRRQNTSITSSFKNIIYDIATQGELANDIGTPLAELSGADGVDTITHGDDGVKIIEQRVAPNLPRTFLLNYRDFLGSCLLVQFIRIIYVLQMQTDVVSGTVKKLCHSLLRSPHCFIFI